MKLTRYMKLTVSLFLMSLVIWWINHGITSYDLYFYSGKDDGVIFRLESLLVMSSVFFMVMAESKKLKALFIGFFIGLLSSILGFILWVSLFHDEGLSFHIISCVLFIAAFYIIEYSGGSKKVLGDFKKRVSKGDDWRIKP